LGADGIPISFVRLSFPVTLKYLAHIVNTALTKSIFPKAWKMAYLLPVGKISRPVELHDYRPISILPCLSKVLEKITKNQILTHIDKFNLLHRFQSGFREGHSTTTALAKIIDDFSSYVANGMVSLLVLLDFSKAFDSVDHGILLDKLFKQFNFSSPSIRLLASYLTDRYQIVKLNEKLSEPSCLISGVPQGSILGPILFSMFINDIANSLTSVKFHLFADDVQIKSFSRARQCRGLRVKYQ
jgi:retron-type reverse transcriptase